MLRLLRPPPAGAPPHDLDQRITRADARPYYRYTTKQIEPDNCVLTPSCLVIVFGLLHRSDPADLRKFQRFSQRQRYDFVLILKGRPALVTPEECIECLPKWDVDSLRKLAVAVGGWKRINRRLLKIRKKAVNNGVKSPLKAKGGICN
ncbi:hypothetical protein PG988_012969 [Apiospora saccharicola]